MPASFANLFKKKSKASTVSDSDPLTPSPVSANTPSSPLAAPVVVTSEHSNYTPQAIDRAFSDARASPDDAMPDDATQAPAHESSSTSPAFDSQSTATTNDVALQITKGNQKFHVEVTNHNEAGKGAVQKYEGGQQFFGQVTNNNIATSSSSGTTAPQPLASTTSSSPLDPVQQITGTRVYHSRLTNNNTLDSGTAQVVEGDQEFWGPVVNNNSRSINGNNTNSNDVNSTITSGNDYRIHETAQASALAADHPG